MYWAQELAAQDVDAELKSRIYSIAKAMTEKRIKNRKRIS